MSTHKLENYKETNFILSQTSLHFEILDESVIVRSSLKFSHRQGMQKKLILNGKDLKLRWIKINGEPVSDYHYENELLSLEVDKDKFEFEAEVEIDPFNNTSCEGLYQSKDILCTQNEAQGFRKITFYYDRPDTMSTFTTKISAPTEKFKYLLSNGDLILDEVKNGKREVTWRDPFPKPCYLFALVAGNLSKINGEYTTLEGKNIKLEFFVNEKDEDKCDYALQSLKHAMRWDEEKFGLAYDLSTYMVVAVDSFTMGAMENKGLNIFNSQYVLAKKETATDSDFQGIEAVIGHEYFHNWTGNRVTCRDWFQLTLKEGLTVFRDQQFSSDMLDAAIKRIEDVKRLRDFQFPEDASKLAHPIKPKEYSEINNFYTATVYDKGAEVIRMIHTILGEKNFRKGIDLYFERHDGKAVTTEDFLAAMSDASQTDLSQFARWYDQKGTPEIFITESYDASTKELRVKISQQALNCQGDELILQIPFRCALFDGDKKVFEDLLLVDQKHEELSFKNISSDYLFSCNRNFSAPVKLHQKRDRQTLLRQFNKEDDSFNKYEAINQLNLQLINDLVAGIEVDLGPYSDTLRSMIKDSKLSSAFKSYLLDVPYYVDVLNTQDKMQIGGQLQSLQNA